MTRLRAAITEARIWFALRLALGWVFLWAFLDKAFALGFSTGRDATTGAVDRFGDAAWIHGGSPTEGFLRFGLHSAHWLERAFGALAGHAWVDWTYMLSMLLIGLGLITGFRARLAAFGGIVWLVMMYLAGSIWPENNPFIDDHVVYALVLAGIIVRGTAPVAARRHDRR